MEKKYLFIIVLFALYVNVKAQTITVNASCAMDGTYQYESDINGKPSYERSSGSSFIIKWSGARWEVISPEGPIAIASEAVFVYNDLDTPTPPASSLSAWIGNDNCPYSGVFSGSGTTTSNSTLSINEIKLNKEIKLFPNSTSDFIELSGLTSAENYILYNTLGIVIGQGNVTNHQQINVKNLNTGLYYIKLTKGSILKFMKN